MRFLYLCNKLTKWYVIYQFALTQKILCKRRIFLLEFVTFNFRLITLGILTITPTFFLSRILPCLILGLCYSTSIQICQFLCIFVTINFYNNLPCNLSENFFKKLAVRKRRKQQQLSMNVLLFAKMLYRYLVNIITAATGDYFFFITLSSLFQIRYLRGRFLLILQ